MADVERPHSPLLVRIVGVAVIALLAVLLFGSALTVVRAAIALAGYIVVAIGAYHVGRWVERHHHTAE